MPKLTVTSALIPGNNIPQASKRKQLILRNTGASTVYFGWETNVSASGSNQGVPLKSDEILSFGGSELDLRGSLQLVCADGETTTVNYTQRD